MTDKHDRRVPKGGRGSSLSGPQWSEGEHSEPERNGGPDNEASSGSRGSLPDPEVPEQAKRRKFTAAYKARILEEVEGCTAPGAVGALLRREGLYSSHLSKWRQQCRAGGMDALRDDKRGRKRTKDPLAEENERLRKQNARLMRRLEQAETIIDIQKKVSTMLGIPLNNIENGEHE